MKTYTKYLKPTAGAIVSVFVGLLLAQSMTLSADVTTDFVPCASEPCYNGSGLTTNPAIDVPHDLTVTQLVLRIINFILDVILIIAVLAIIIAGVYLITGLGSESSKEKAKSIILYVIIGILVILFSRAIVVFFMGLFS